MQGWSGVTTFLTQICEAFRQSGHPLREVALPPLDQLEEKVLEGVHTPNVGGALRAATVPVECSGRTRDVARNAPSPIMNEGQFVRDIKLSAGYLLELYRDIRMVWRLRRQWRGCVIVVNEFGCETVPVALRFVAPWSRIVAISHTHPGHGVDANHWVRCWLERLCYWSVSDILYNSDASRREWSAKLGVSASKGRVIHLGTESPDLSVPSDYPAREPDTVDFVCVARFVAWKGQSNLVRVWQEVVKKGNNSARLILIGGGPCLDSVRLAAELAKLGTRVVFMGERTKADRYFNAADVAVLMSNEPEAFGLVLLEAMSRGKPVLASRLGGIPEIVIEGETGLLVDPFDYESAAQRVCLLAASADDRFRLGANGRKRWADHFTVDKMKHEFEDYFDLV